MNYELIYQKIINNATSENRNKSISRYYEQHHIVPKSLGGSDESSNLVLLTPKEHFVCHLLLVKIHKHDEEKHIKMLRAFLIMAGLNQYQQKRYINSSLYEKIKNKLYGTNGLLTGENSTFYGKKHSDEAIKKMSEGKKGPLNPNYGKEPWNKGKTKDTCDIIKKSTEKMINSEYHRNRPPVHEETKLKHSENAIKYGLGKIKTETHKQSISKSMKDKIKNNPEFRKKHKENSKKGAAKAAELLRGKPKEKVECPYCGKVGGKPAMKRYHFDNCKEKR